MLLSLALAALATLAQEPPPIDELIRKLGSEDFAEREKATEELRRIGKPAEEALRKAAESDDPEVRTRAQALLRGAAPAPKGKPFDPAQGKPEPRRAPRPGPFPGFPGFRGSSVQVQSVNGASTYLITPGDGAPSITFRKGADGAVKLEYTDGDGKAQVAEAASLEAFLKDHAELARRHGITEEGIDYAGARVSFKGGLFPRGNEFNFNFGQRNPRPLPPDEAPRPLPPPPRGDFEPASEVLRAQLGLPDGQGWVALREGILPGLRRFDVVVEVDGRPVASPADLRNLKAQTPLTVIRKGEKLVLKGERKDF
jgi:hypothetical protein